MNRRRFFSALAVLPMVPAIASAVPDGFMTMVSVPDAGREIPVWVGVDLAAAGDATTLSLNGENFMWHRGEWVAL